MLAPNYGLIIDELAKKAAQIIDFPVTPNTIQAVDSKHTIISTRLQEENSILERLNRIEENDDLQQGSRQCERLHIMLVSLQIGKRDRKCVPPCKYTKDFKSSKNNQANQ